MFPVSEANFFVMKNIGGFINICHKTAAAIDESDKSDVGVFLLLNFS